MIDSALKGSFTEKVFDESRLSALETKFAQYLSGQTCSTQNIMHEKDSIKTLIADISHQTKTPVSNILLYCELLLEDDLSENSKNNLMALYSQTKKLRFLIEYLIKLSRLETGIISLSPKKQEIQPLLDKIFIQYNQKADSKDLYLNTVKTDATAVFDEKWTLEALCNIVDNAIKYTVTGGISINVIVYEFFVRIDISDTGIGISDNEHEKVFSRFYRSEKANTTEGVGIGLYLARKIITGENVISKFLLYRNTAQLFPYFFQNCKISYCVLKDFGKFYMPYYYSKILQIFFQNGGHYDNTKNRKSYKNLWLR